MIKHVVTENESSFLKKKKPVQTTIQSQLSWGFPSLFFVHHEGWVFTQFPTHIRLTMPELQEDVQAMSLCPHLEWAKRLIAW